MVRPTFLFLMGAIPTELISSEPMLGLREKWLMYQENGQQIPTRVSFPLKMILDNPELCRRKAWEDLCALKELMDGKNAT